MGTSEKGGEKRRFCFPIAADKEYMTISMETRGGGVRPSSNFNKKSFSRFALNSCIGLCHLLKGACSEIWKNSFVKRHTVIWSLFNRYIIQGDKF